MIRITLGKAELVLAIAWVVLRGISCLCRRRVDLKREAILLLVYLNLARSRRLSCSRATSTISSTSSASSSKVIRELPRLLGRSCLSSPDMTTFFPR